jgi:methylmalonyl-CoA mutase N-terminal domain/subunit
MSWQPSGRASTPGQLDGTLQTDIFKEYIAQKEWIFPPEPHLRLIGDLMEFYTDAEMPRYKPLSVSGYHIREAGSTAAQELAFTLADGFGYVELGLSSGPGRRTASRRV